MRRGDAARERYKRGEVHIPHPWWLLNHVPSGPTDRPIHEPRGRRRRIVGPLGRRTTWSGGPFPARWAGLGERLARWAGSWFGVRGPTVRTTSRLRPIQPARRERGPLCPLRWAFVGRPPHRRAENQSGSVWPPSAGSLSEPTVRLGPETGGRGGGPLCPLRWAFVGRQPRRGGP